MPPLAPLIVLALVVLFVIRKIQARRRAVTLDLTLGDPTARALLDATRHGDGDAVARIITDTHDPVVRHHALMLLTDVPGRPGWADGLIDRQPHQQAAWLASAASLIGHAWEIRGRGYATMVEEDAWPAFFTVLIEADHQLERAIKLDSNDPMPYVLGLIAARGLQLERPVADERFRAAIAREPFHPGAIDHRLQYLCAKWHGSTEEMFDFARWVLNTAPPGSPAHRAVPMAHIEHRLAIQRDNLGGRAHFSRPEVVAELREAAARSVFHPAFVDDLAGVQTLNTFALAMSWALEFEASNRLFTAIGDRVTEFPWVYAGQPAVRHAEHRDLARRRG